MIKFNQVHIISDSDWDQFVKEQYGKKYYSFQQQDGCRDRGNYHINVDYITKDDFFENTEVGLIVNCDEMGVSLKAWIDKKDEFFGDELGERLFWQRNFYPSVEEIALDLYNKGVIPHKVFQINVDW